MLETVVVLRHATAGDRSAWPGDDLTRPLDPSGVADALALAAGFEGWPIDAIWTSPAVRCCHTVAALAATRRIPVHDADWLLAAATPDQLEGGVAALGPSSLLCIHGESFAAVVTALFDRAVGFDTTDVAALVDPQLDKGAALGLRFDAGLLIEAEAIPAPTRAPAPILAAPA